MNPYRCVYRGGHGGADPPTEPSPRLYSPPKRCFPREPSLWVPMETIPRGANPQRGNPSGGFPEQSLPRMAPPSLGIARICWGVFLVAIVTDFLPIYMDFLGRFILSP